MTVDTDELTLLKLFTRLREAGLPLGIAEYQVLLRALQSGFGVDSVTSLARVCKVIWTKAPDEQRLFDYHFQSLADELTRPSRDMDQDTESISRFPQPGIDSYTLPDTDTLPAPIVEPEPASFAKDEHLTPEPSPSAGLALQNNDEIQVVQALRVSSREYEARPKRFRLADEYLPITRRQMKQSWRHLRLLSR